MVQGSGFRDYGLEFRVEVSGFRLHGLWFRVQGLRLRTESSECRV
jgi:hypothetical protein